MSDEIRAPAFRFTHWIPRLLELSAWVTGRGGKRSESVERVLLGAAVLIFVAATVSAWSRLPDAHRQPPDLSWACLAAGFAVVTLWLNAGEFGLSAKLVGRRVCANEAIRVSVLGSAANVLPLPGAILVRARALRQAGERSGTALTTTVAVGLVWVSAASILAGSVLVLTNGSLILVLAFLLGGVLLMALAGSVLLVYGHRPPITAAGALVVLEFASVLTSALRLYALGKATDFEIGAVEAVTLNLGAILSSVVGVLPGGLGVREIATGLFGGLVGLSGSVGVLVSVLDRLILFPVLALAVATLWLTNRVSSGELARGSEPTDTS